MAIEPPKTQRDQLLLFGAVLGLALIGLFWFYIYDPKSKALDLVQVRIDSLAAQNEIARKEIAKGTATKLKEEADMYGRMLVVMRTLVPSASEVPELIDEISTAARRTGLELGGVQAPVIISGDVFDTHKYKLSVSGPYHRLNHFLTNVGSLKRIVAPINISLSPPPGATKGGSNPAEQVLDMQFEIQTYVAKGGRAQ
jgi:type IV pilus assembly protein PilO